MEDLVYICPECRKIFKVQGNDKIVKCAQCSSKLIDTNVTMEEWSKYDPQKKEEIKNRLCDRDDKKASETQTEKQPDEKPNEQSYKKSDKQPDKQPDKQVDVPETPKKSSFFDDIEAKTVICPYCNAENEDGSQFCHACGKSLSQKSGNISNSAIVKKLLIIFGVWAAVMVVVVLLILKPWEDVQSEYKTQEAVQEESSSEEASQTAAMEEQTAEVTDDVTDEGQITSSAEEALLEYAKGLDYISGLVGFYDVKITETDQGGYTTQNADKDLSKIPFGNVDCFIDDYDKDGQDELLIISAEGPDNVSMTLLMYEYNGEVKLADTYDMEKYYYPGYDSSQWLYMNYDFDGTKYFGALCSGDVYLMADGVSVGFFSCYYDGNSFVKMGATGYSCSDWSDEDNRVTDELRRCGVNIAWNDLFEGDYFKEVLSATNGEQMIEVDQCTNVHEQDKENMRYTKMAGYIKYKGYSSYEFTKHEDTSGLEDYILTDSSERLLTEEDLSGLSNDMLRKARNEIVARHGRRFKDKELQAYFDSKLWYEGTYEPDDFERFVQLSEIEQKNMEFIQQHESN